jgi:hypothetical protein
MSSDRARKVKRIVFSDSESDKNSPDNNLKRTKSTTADGIISDKGEDKLMWPG